MEEAWELAALAMPVWLRYKGWRFHVFAGDTTRRPHVHVSKPGQEVKIWLDELEIADSSNVKPSDLRDLQRHAKKNADLLMNKWTEQFPNG